MYWRQATIYKYVSLRCTTDNSDVYCTRFLILINRTMFNSFLRFVCFMLDIPHLAHNYTNFTNLLDLPTLAEPRRILNLLMFAIPNKF